MIGWDKDIKVGDRVTYIGKNTIYRTLTNNFKFVKNETQGTITEINEGHPSRTFKGCGNTIYGPWNGYAIVLWDNNSENGKLIPTKEGITWERSVG